LPGSLWRLQWFNTRFAESTAGFLGLHPCGVVPIRNSKKNVGALEI
jgi:hypothetical protein